MCDSQTTDHNKDVRIVVVNGEQERAKANVDMGEQREELDVQDDVDEDLAENSDEPCDDHHEQVGAVIIVAVRRAREEGSHAHIRGDEQRGNVVAVPSDSRNRYITAGDDAGFGGRSNIRTCQTMREKKAETNLTR
jgi:hypothetical protein